MDIAQKKKRILGAVDDKLMEYVVQPLTDRGYPNAGAAVGAAGASAAQAVADRVPESVADVGLALTGTKGVARALPDGIRKQLEEVAREKGVDLKDLLFKANKKYGGAQREASEQLIGIGRADEAKKALLKGVGKP